MKKVFLFAILFTLIIPSFAPHVAQAGACFSDPVYDRAWTATVTTGARVRDVACMEGSVVTTTLAVGTSVNIIGETDGWYKVQTAQGVTGWVGQWLVSITDENSANVSVTTTAPEEAEPVATSDLLSRTRGRILLQVEQNGEAWYVHPDRDLRYYMKDGATAYQMMRSFGLGITDTDLAKIPSVADKDAMLTASSVCTTNPIAKSVSGKILLQVEQHGEAWYVHPDTCRRIYLKDGETAYSVMRYLSLGITTTDLNTLATGTVEVK